MTPSTAQRKLSGKKIAILATDGVEEVELTKPRMLLMEAGAETVLISPKKDELQAFQHHEKGARLKVDLALDQATAESFDALVLPGGVANPDSLRTEPKAVEFVRAMVAAGKPVAAICHGPWLLVEAGVVRGRRVTSWPSLRTDLTNAGGKWSDEEVIVDRGIVTSRKPDDIPAFTRKLIDEIGAANAKQ